MCVHGWFSKSGHKWLWKPMIINTHNTQIININYGIMIQGTGDSIAQLYFICITWSDIVTCIVTQHSYTDIELSGLALGVMPQYFQCTTITREKSAIHSSWFCIIDLWGLPKIQQYLSCTVLKVTLLYQALNALLYINLRDLIVGLSILW